MLLGQHVNVALERSVATGLVGPLASKGPTNPSWPITRRSLGSGAGLCVIEGAAKCTVCCRRVFAPIFPFPTKARRSGIGRIPSLRAMAKGMMGG
jgi:hypothetical protein